MAKTVGLKFETAPNDTPSVCRLEDMTVPQLKQLAAEYKIDLGKAVKKDEIIQAILTVLSNLEV
ncbi:Rho termination factor N-terminal domain-containing protein [Ruminococcus sp. Marseille-P6503]|uniref:Rho termination factor N-terminal domain-containing protein n=1 Tax=Ruminococcus sp. Marseille-P6503 TaxID=2364796 RepID=UPI000F51BE6D|nr:Rho termination factor N-terminal domain-containing protein [Ruminococcus sp. Marseille-P6503]